MNINDIKYNIINLLDNTPFCIIATANKKGIVSTAQMCLINDGLNIYIQTDNSFEKIKNIKENNNVAINIGAYNFKGNAKIIGHPTLNDLYIKKIREKHLKTYEHYTNLKNEVLVKIKLTECKIWGIKNAYNKETILVVDLINEKIKEIICDKM